MNKDAFLIECLKNILVLLREERDDIKGNDDFSRECIDEVNDCEEILNGLMPYIKGIESLYELEEDEFYFIVELLEEYSDNFVVDGRTESSLKETEKEYNMLCDILFELYDDEEEN